MTRICLIAGLSIPVAASLAFIWTSELPALTFWQQISYAIGGFIVMSLVLFLLPEKPSSRDDRNEFGGS